MSTAPVTPGTDLPDYDRPPVVEVACGIHFSPLKSLLAPHLGLLWERFKPEYPICQEVAPLSPVIERFDQPASIDVELTDKPPLPRIWFIHERETGIVQVQRDRFLHNWKKIRPEDEYPRYPTVIKLFRDRLSRFETFLDDTNLGSIEPLQYELTYVNHILSGEGWNTISEVGQIFPDSAWRAGTDRFLSTPETISWRSSFVLPDQVGRLHVSIRNGNRKQDNRSVVVCELTARGMSNDTSRDAMWQWFDLAREWIVRGFADLAGAEIQSRRWGRTR